MQFERELLKGVLPAAVMEVLSRKAMYGYELSEEMERREQGDFYTGQRDALPAALQSGGERVRQGDLGYGADGAGAEILCADVEGRTEAGEIASAAQSASARTGPGVSAQRVAGVIKKNCQRSAFNCQLKKKDGGRGTPYLLRMKNEPRTKKGDP